MSLVPVGKKSSSAVVYREIDSNRQMWVFFASTRKQASCRSDLERFIFSYSSKSKDYDRSDPLVHFWLNKVAPSCVYPIRVDDEPVFYQCCICSVPIRRQMHMIRHYREQHFCEIPANIFGPLDLFPCRLCQVEFTRHENLISHLQSISHMQALVSKGSRASSQQFEALNDAKLHHRQLKETAKRNRFEQEQEEWERSNNAAAAARANRRCIEPLVEENDVVVDVVDDDVDDGPATKKVRRHDKTDNDGARPSPRTSVESNRIDDSRVDHTDSNAMIITTTTTTTTMKSNSSREIDELATSLTRSASLMERLAANNNSSPNRISKNNRSKSSATAFPFL